MTTQQGNGGGMGVGALAAAVPNLVKLVWGLARDDRVPARAKATLWFTVVYLVSPLDLVPSFIPGLGQLDDVVLAALTLNQLLNNVPEEVVREHWDGDADVLEVIQEALRFATSLLPARVRKLFAAR
jgi:uncharacterized membrane protein YkvA (DUF1232 family)